MNSYYTSWLVRAAHYAEMETKLFKRRQELIELVEAEAYAERLAAATKQVSQ